MSVDTEQPAIVVVVFGYGMADARVTRPTWQYLSAEDLDAARRALVKELAACTGEQIRRQNATGGKA
jgi:hypothetical protein